MNFKIDFGFQHIPKATSFALNTFTVFVQSMSLQRLIVMVQNLLIAQSYTNDSIILTKNLTF